MWSVMRNWGRWKEYARMFTEIRIAGLISGLGRVLAFERFRDRRVWHA